jgi:hypothetical protein
MIWTKVARGWRGEERPAPVVLEEREGGVKAFGYHPIPPTDSQAWTPVENARTPLLGIEVQIGNRIGVVAGTMLTPTGVLVRLLDTSERTEVTEDELRAEADIVRIDMEDRALKAVIKERRGNHGVL